MLASNESTDRPAEPGPPCGHWMPRLQAHCTRSASHPGRHRSRSAEPPGDRPACGRWMPRKKSACARKPGHQGACRSAESLIQNRPRKTSRRIGVRVADDPAVRARWKRSHKFVRLGITEVQFNEMVAAQGYACAVCRKPFGEGQRICADHDHHCCPKQADATAKTCGQCIRGLLCVPCNTNLGWYERFGSSVTAYLARQATGKGVQPAQRPRS
jgi:hypothetical protein